jgi:hypothetical protein
MVEGAATQDILRSSTGSSIKDLCTSDPDVSGRLSSAALETVYKGHPLLKLKLLDV